jgi:polyhydroxyalkanoate synthase
LIGWAQNNDLFEGRWKVAGKPITPPPASLPTFIAIPKNDHVVPYDCAMGLAKLCKKAHVINPSAGHVGMIVGSHAKRELWQSYASWLGKNH